MERQDSESGFSRELGGLSRATTPSAWSGRSSFREASTSSRPSTPKWWRPSYPPETYLWEEIRRKRKRGGYPWNYLDKEKENMGDNLYEPVNPQSYYGSGMIKQDPETASLDDRLIEIPPELDIITSEGLDGLDKRDKYDYEFDGEKEWRHFHMEQDVAEVPATKSFTAGIRQELPSYGETSSERPLRTKSPAAAGDQVVPEGEAKPNALTQLKNKAEQMKKQLSKISLPAKPKFNTWSGIKLTKKKSKGEEEVRVEDNEEILDQIQRASVEQKMSEERPGEKVRPPKPPPPKLQPQPSTSKAGQASDLYQAELVLERPKSQASMKDDKSILDEAKLEEKRQKDEELKKKKQEEKAVKDKIQEELKKAKADEKAAKDKVKEERKRAEAEDKLLRKKQEEELKRAKEEEIRKAQQEAVDRKILVQNQSGPADITKISATAQAAKQKVEDEKRLIKDERKKAQEYELKSKQLEESIEAEIIRNAENAQVDQPQKGRKSRADAFKRKLADIDFTKRFKRSKTPPASSDEKPEHKKPPRLKFTQAGYTNDETDNKLAAQYAKEILSRDADMEIERGKEQREQPRLQEPVIYVTQPSVETADSESRSTDLNKQGSPLHYENLPADQQPQGQDEKAKFGEKMKKSTKVLGNRMKLIGHDLKEFGGKVNFRCKEHVKEFKATQEAAKKRSRELKEEEEEKKRQQIEDGEMEEKQEKAPKTSFRFKRRPLNDQDIPKREDAPIVTAVKRKPKPPKALPGDMGRDQQQEGGKVRRNDVLGNADRDWESPLDLVRSRDASEEPSGRGSPPGSSIASSRRQGVLEEIDSDEFFLRERGISEGEDEEEVNRLLMHELRQTFRPLDNSLRGFDMPSPPPRPPRSPRKPSRKSRGPADEGKENFQTFPPERPKRKQTPGYISAYLNQTRDKPYEVNETPLKMGEEEEEEFLAMESDEEEEEDEGIRRVKLELRRIDQDMEEEKVRYEPVLSESPQRPRRMKKSKSGRGDSSEAQKKPQIFYYNTIGANEWMKELEGQIERKEVDGGQTGAAGESIKFPPAVPKRVRRKSEGGKSWKSDGGRSGKSEAQSDIDNTTVELTRGSSSGNQDDLRSLSVQVDQSDNSTTPTTAIDLTGDDSLEYVDYDEDDGGSGYAMVVHKKFKVEQDLPKTVPRKKHRIDKSKKTHSLKRRSQEGENGNGKNVNCEGQKSPTPTSPAMFCSLPRFTPRTFHIVPPTRPNRTTYSSLKPRRPPRHQKGAPTQQQHEPAGTGSASPRGSPRVTEGGERTLFEDRERPSSGGPGVGSIQERPLPPPPRPQRSPVPLNDLDHSNIERMVGTRHYANFIGEVDEEDGRVPVVEELCVAKNIPLLGREGEENDNFGVDLSESNVGIQTDPVHDEELDLNAIGSFEEEDDGIDKQRDSTYRTSSSDGPDLSARQRFQGQPWLAQQQQGQGRGGDGAPAAPTSTQVIFPSRLHLDELEVDFLRVNELTAQSLTMDHLHSPTLYVDSMSSAGALVVPLIQSSNLAVDQVNTERISASDASMPSIPPQSFYQLASPSTQEQESVQQRQSPLSFIPRAQQTQSHVTGVGSRRSSDEVLQLTARLGRAIFNTISRGLDSLTDFLDTTLSTDPEHQAKQRSQIQILLCLLLVLIVGIFLMSGRENPSNQRWEFFLPPPDL